MAAEPNNTPLVVIVGETASGKTALAIKLATLFNGAIISADSRTIYRGMDIASAKPTAAELRQVRHYMIDILQPDQVFSAAQFKIAALKSIAEINRDAHIPMSPALPTALAPKSAKVSSTTIRACFDVNVMQFAP